MSSKLVSILAAVGVFIPYPTEVLSQANVSARCLVAPKSEVVLSRTPSAVWGLAPEVSRPAEGIIALHSSDALEYEIMSPVGDFTSVAGPFDPKAKRLYIWAYFSNGWVEVTKPADTWLFGDKGVIEPNLYHPASDIEDVVPVQRSEALMAQYYSGFTKPHWLSGNQSYQVYQIVGETFTRVSALEERMLRYVGDDPINKLAVFAPHDVNWTERPDELVWWNGESIVEPESELSRPIIWCHLLN